MITLDFFLLYEVNSIAPPSPQRLKSRYATVYKHLIETDHTCININNMDILHVNEQGQKLGTLDQLTHKNI